MNNSIRQTKEKIIENLQGGKKIFARVNISNEVEDYYFELEIYCPKPKDLEKIRKIIEDFRRENRFYGSYKYIEELKKAGYSAERVECDIEV